ncbi:hypothetical protein [Enterovibrio baiacu]|uniref:hypothetical protein n=1 Tax=Enterovibrio baiacu TaxID=2491023 RepID=UPI0010118511|nr:hypothetical protein [Enterovibrio baiacu]MBE1275012.1 hypothetical protein [Enterovibrio baiacu]
MLKRIKFTSLNLINAGLLSFFIGMTTMTQASSQPEGPESIPFSTHCLGRYLIDLPQDMALLKLSVVHPIYQFNTFGSGAIRGRDNKGLLEGKERIATWLKMVDEEKIKYYQENPAQYVAQKLDQDIKVGVIEVDLKALREDPNADRLFQTYLLVDNPDIKKSLVVNEIYDLRLPKGQKDATEKINARAANLVKAASNIELGNVSNTNAVGLCFPDGITVHASSPEKDTDGSYRELYTVSFRNGKNSSLEFDVTTYPSGAESSLEEETDKASGLWAMLASKKVTVAGREGRLFISDGQYSSSQREFVWTSSDSKTNSVRNTHIQISGELEIEDYPQMKPLNATDVIIALLKSIRIRENGMAGVTN